MARRKRTWSARWQRTGTHIVLNGGRVVDLNAVIDENGPHHERPIRIDLTPETARDLAESLWRNADEAETYNRRAAPETHEETKEAHE